MKKEDEGMEAEGAMEAIEGVDDKNTFSGKISNTEIQELLDKIALHAEKTPNNQNIKLEHNLLTKANETVARINLEISNIYRIHIREMYSKRFPELEHQVFHPLDYARVVRKLGNNLAKINELHDILPAANIITISMTASSTSGVNLSDEELETLNASCDFVLDLDESRQKILAFVESRMKVFAPNLTEIVGSEIAAKLIGAAGSLQTLATMPAQNIQVLGRTKKQLAGFSKVGINKLGFLGECDIITQNTPQHLEVKAVRVIANKCSLAARLDLMMDGKSLNGEVGVKFREEIEKAIEKWQEPPPARQDKPLRAPDDIVTKRRGGAKARKRKDLYGQTELSKKANRLPFGKLTEDVGNSMKSLGMLGMEGSGMVRLNVRDEKGMKVKLTNIKKKNDGSKTQTHGFATSVYAITPMQGLELKASTVERKELPPTTPTTSYFDNTGFINRQKT